VSDLPLLLLFDVDGTLLRGATDAHRDALHAALHEVHGIDAARAHWTLSPAGRTDGEIARAILLGAGISAQRIDDRYADVREACCRHYAELCPPDLSEFVLPGVPELLRSLAATDVRLALVTGNFEPVARLKLARARVGQWFASGQGAFGSDAEDRVALPPIARRRAATPDHPHPRERTLVIGDTPRDIACAHADDLRCIAVATGPFAADALTDADAVVGAASEIAPAIAALG
jgi:phosphoglycolate phosphatase-like HAD superfamily hydrolase